MHMLMRNCTVLPVTHTFNLGNLVQDFAVSRFLLTYGCDTVSRSLSTTAKACFHYICRKRWSSTWLMEYYCVSLYVSLMWITTVLSSWTRRMNVHSTPMFSLDFSERSNILSLLIWDLVCISYTLIWYVFFCRFNKCTIWNDVPLISIPVLFWNTAN